MQIAIKLFSFFQPQMLFQYGMEDGMTGKFFGKCAHVADIEHRKSMQENIFSAPSAEQRWIWSERMNENKYYLKIDNRIIAERVSLEHALIFIKSIFENYYNDHEIVISIAEMKRYEDDEVDE